jgi:hypothetical protein
MGKTRHQDGFQLEGQVGDEIFGGSGLQPPICATALKSE